MTTTAEPRSAGTILSLKRDAFSDDNNRACHAKAREILARHQQLQQQQLQQSRGLEESTPPPPPLPEPKRARCSRRFNGLTFRQPRHEVCSDECLEELRREGLLETCEPDYEARACGEDNNTWAEKCIGIITGDDDGRSTKDTTTDVDVFVIDTGVDPSNPYLNVEELKSFVDGEPEDADQNGHGTMCASIIASRGNKEQEGVVPGARVHGLKVLGRDGGGAFSDIIEAVEHAAEYKESHPERRVVVNMSLGGRVGTTAYTALDRQIQEAQDANAMAFVVAAGNSSDDASLYAPAHTKSIITVGAYDAEDRFSGFSNYGHAVDILAPGTQVPTAGLGGRMETVSGTSFSSPFVAGVVARNLVLHEKHQQQNDSGRTPTLRMIGDLIGSAVMTPAVRGVPDGTSRARAQVKSL